MIEADIKIKSGYNDQILFFRVKLLHPVFIKEYWDRDNLKSEGFYMSCKILQIKNSHHHLDDDDLENTLYIPIMHITDDIIEGSSVVMEDQEGIEVYDVNKIQTTHYVLD